VRVEGEEDGLEAGEGFAEGDAGEVNAGDDGEEAEGDELEVRVAGLECVVEPATEVVFSGAGVGVAEERGDLGGDFGDVEEREGGGVEGRMEESDWMADWVLKGSPDWKVS
jgi:hypothetical protein